MGLDMYLSAAKYLSGWNHSTEREKKEFECIVKAIGLRAEDVTAQAPSGTCKFHVAYWRKANAIHKWFVDNVQDGEDQCRPHYVSREQLEELVTLCREVLANRGNVEKVTELLPPQEGCFFGSYNIDGYYFGDIEDTIKQLTAILQNERLKGFDFEYQSSW